MNIDKTIKKTIHEQKLIDKRLDFIFALTTKNQSSINILQLDYIDLWEKYEELKRNLELQKKRITALFKHINSIGPENITLKDPKGG